MRPVSFTLLGGITGALLLALAGTALRSSSSPPAQVGAPPRPGTIQSSGRALDAAQTTRVALTGFLVRVDGNTLTVVDGEGEHRFEAGDRTEVSRGEAHVLRTDRVLSRLRLGDNLWVAATLTADGVTRADSISVNALIGRDGIVVASVPGYIDVRLRKDRLSADFQDEPTRFAIDPAAQIVGLPMNRTLDTLADGTRAVVQGFIAEDGVLVAEHVWLTGP